jgi:hypothetical protein
MGLHISSVTDPNKDQNPKDLAGADPKINSYSSRIGNFLGGSRHCF